MPLAVVQLHPVKCHVSGMTVHSNCASNVHSDVHSLLVLKRVQSGSVVWWEWDEIMLVEGQ